MHLTLSPVITKGYQWLHKPIDVKELVFALSKNKDSEDNIINRLDPDDSYTIEFRKICPDNESLYKMSGLDVSTYKDQIEYFRIEKIRKTDHNTYVIKVDIKLKDGLQLCYHVYPYEKAIWSVNTKKTNPDKKYSNILINRLINMKELGIQKVRNNAGRPDNKWIYWYNIWLKYGYDVRPDTEWMYAHSREKLLEKLSQIIEKIDDNEARTQRIDFLAPYKTNNPPDLLMPRLSENEVLRAIWREHGFLFKTELRLTDGDPTREFFKKHYIDTKTIE